MIRIPVRFTASAILKLAEAGILDLNDRLADILPDLNIADKRYEEIRLWQMLSHTAGIGDVMSYEWEKALTGASALSDYVHSREVTDLPLLWEPGKGGFRYSNIAYEILGHIVSEKSEQYAGEHLSYEAFVKRFLLEPAGMRDSTMLTFERIGVTEGDVCPRITDEIRRRNADAKAGWSPMALPHEKAEDRSIVPVTFYPYNRSHGPSSTLTSNVSDLMQWMRANMDGFSRAEKAAEEARCGAEEKAAEEAWCGADAEPHPDRTPGGGTVEDEAGNDTSLLYKIVDYKNTKYDRTELTTEGKSTKYVINCKLMITFSKDRYNRDMAVLEDNINRAKKAVDTKEQIKA